MSKLSLPEPIAAYFDADKRDGEAVARCFTNQGVVEDEGQDKTMGGYWVPRICKCGLSNDRRESLIITAE